VNLVLRCALALAAAALLACSTAPPKSRAGTVGSASPRLQADNDVERRWLGICEEVQGRPYRKGGVDRNGFDCSGLVQYAYRRYDGRALPRTTRDLYRAGKPVDKVKTGDLLFYGTPEGRPTHVGIYFWANWFLHAGNDGVTLSSTRERYYADRYLGARRLP